jgi:hypothetical protein
MKLLVARFVVTVVLFVGWLGFLAFEVSTRPVLPDEQPLVLSRPQFLTSKLDIVAELPAESKPDGKWVKVKEVLGGEGVKLGDSIRILNLDDCLPPSGHQPTSGRWQPPPGDYLIPLVAPRPEVGKSAPKDTYEVNPIPSSPGYSPDRKPRIYPATVEARKQYSIIPKPES